VARLLLVVEVPHARDERTVALLLGPVDCFFLGLRRVHLVIARTFNDVIGDRVAFRPTFRARAEAAAGGPGGGPAGDDGTRLRIGAS
jgi:hypothetical protein